MSQYILSLPNFFATSGDARSSAHPKVSFLLTGHLMESLLHWVSALQALWLPISISWGYHHNVCCSGSVPPSLTHHTCHHLSSSHFLLISITMSPHPHIRTSSRGLFFLHIARSWYWHRDTRNGNAWRWHAHRWYRHAGGWRRSPHVAWRIRTGSRFAKAFYL